MTATDVLQTESMGVLYVVATPIGNLQDISRRAVDVLSAVQLIAAEDTRRTRMLLDALGVAAPRFTPLHEHNEERAGTAIIAQLQAGADVALVSDAGTPLLSDPGFSLVRACYAQGLAVRPVPGPSALATALSVCPLPTTDFRFIGFLPARSAGRKARLEAAAALGPVAFFEAPHRMQACLADIEQVSPGRRLFIGREMTKKFESYLCDLPANLARRLTEQHEFKGEFVCLLEGPGVSDQTSAELNAEAQRTMRILCRALPPAQAAKVGAELLGINRRELYRLALELNDQ